MIDNSNDPNDTFTPIIKTAMRSGVKNDVYRLRSDFLIKSFVKHCCFHDKDLQKQIDDLKAELKTVYSGHSKLSQKGCAIRIDSLKSRISEREDKKTRHVYFQTDTKQLMHLACEVESDTMLQMIMQNSIFYSARKYLVCKNCSIDLAPPIELSVVPMDYPNATVKNIQQYLKPSKKTSMRRCTKCNNYGEFEVIASRIIVIDCEQFNQNHKTTHDQIADHIIFNEKRYNLKAIVVFVLWGDSNHFVAYIKRPSNIWECYDDMSTKVYKAKGSFTPKKLFYLMDESEEDPQTPSPANTTDDVSMKSDISMKINVSNEKSNTSADVSMKVHDISTKIDEKKELKCEIKLGMTDLIFTSPKNKIGV